MHDPLAYLEERGITVVRDGGPAARLEYPDEATARVYRGLTGAGRLVGVSLYFIDHWLDVVRSKHYAILSRLWGTARRGRRPRRTLRQLAESVRLKEDVAREFLAWWEEPRPDDLEWLVMRAYVQEIRPCGPGGRAGRPYEFSVLVDDVLHPEHRDTFDQMVEAFGSEGGQRAFRLPDHYPQEESEFPGLLAPEESVFPGLPVCPSVERVGISGSSESARHKPPQEESEFPGLLHPPVPPMPCLRGHGHGLRSPNPISAPSELAGEAAASLSELGATDADVRRLLASHPDAAQWAARWCEWVKAKQGLRKPVNFVFSRVRAACAGDPDAQQEPWAYTRLTEEHDRRRKELQRTAAILAERPALVLPKAPAPELPPVPEELRPLWSAALEAICQHSELLGGLLSVSRPLRLEGGTLVIDAGGSAEGLRRKREQLAGWLQAAGLTDVTEIRFVNPDQKGPHGTL